MSRRQHARKVRQQVRAARQRAWYAAHADAATDPVHRVTAAFDYLRARLTEADADERDRVARAVSDYLLQAGDSIQTGRKSRLPPHRVNERQRAAVPFRPPPVSPTCRPRTRAYETASCGSRSVYGTACALLACGPATRPSP